MIKMLLWTLVSAIVTFLLGMFLLAITVHSDGVVQIFGLCLVPGMFVLYILLHTGYDMLVGFVALFFLFWLAGRVFLWRRSRLEEWWLPKQEKLIGGLLPG